MKKCNKIILSMMLATSFASNAVSLNSSTSATLAATDAVQTSLQSSSGGLVSGADSGNLSLGLSHAFVGISSAGPIFNSGSSSSGINEISASSLSSPSNPIVSLNGSSSNIPSSSVGSLGSISGSSGGGTTSLGDLSLSLDGSGSLANSSVFSSVQSSSLTNSPASISSTNSNASLGFSSGAGGSIDGASVTSISSGSTPLGLIGGLVGFLFGNKNSKQTPIPPVAECKEGVPGCGGIAKPAPPVIVPPFPISREETTRFF